MDGPRFRRGSVYWSLTRIAWLRYFADPGRRAFEFHNFVSIQHGHRSSNACCQPMIVQSGDGSTRPWEVKCSSTKTSDTQHRCVVCPFADETSHVGYQTRRAIDMPRRRVVQAEKTMLGLVFEACIALVVECCVFGIWHCIVDQATGVGCEEILREASASRSANSQVTQSPHAIPAAKAPLGCALCPVTSSSKNSPHPFQSILQSAFGVLS